MKKLMRTQFVMMVMTALALLFAPGEASARHSKLKGGLTTEQVECDGLCTAGPLTGGLAGQLEFTMDSMQETSNPDVVTYVGVNTITTKRGTLVGTDYGIWNLVTGEFVDFTVWTDGTGKYEGARGYLLIVGTFDPVTGTGSSDYFAVVR